MRWNTRSLVFLALGISAAYAASGRSPSITDAARAETELDLGRTVYDKQCAPCHGTEGDGRGPTAYLQDPKPRDFTRASFRLVSTQNGVPTDDDLLLTIRRGMPGSSMPSWAHLPDEQLDAVVAHVRLLVREGIRKRLENPYEDEEELTPEQIERAVAAQTTPGEPVPVPAEISATPRLLARGKEVYLDSCASCHGPDGKGKGIDVRYTIEGDPTFPRDFTAGIFKGKPDPRDLYIRTRAGMPGTPMPSSDFTDEEVWALVHLVRSMVDPEAQARAEIRRLEWTAPRAAFEGTPGPDDPAWEGVEPVFVSLMPLWWRDDRVEGVKLRAIHDGKTIALRLEWADPTRDAIAVAPQDFTDMAAVQFSAEEDPPFFGMGGPAGSVNIWAWKAVRQDDMAGYVDLEDRYPALVAGHYQGEKGAEPGVHRGIEEATIDKMDPTYVTGLGAGNPISRPDRKTPVEDLEARSQGTLTFQPPLSQEVDGKGEWAGGTWTVVLARPLVTEHPTDVRFAPGGTVSIALAVWDGSAGDRNGQKSVSIWHRLTLAP